MKDVVGFVLAKNTVATPHCVALRLRVPLRLVIMVVMVDSGHAREIGVPNLSGNPLQVNPLHLPTGTYTTLVGECGGVEVLCAFLPTALLCGR